jgi:hypothetical protein
VEGTGIVSLLRKALVACLALIASVSVLVHVHGVDGGRDARTSDSDGAASETQVLQLSLDSDHGVARVSIEASGPVTATVEATYTDTPSMDALLFIDSPEAPPVIPVYDAEAPPTVTMGAGPADELVHQASWAAEQGSTEGTGTLHTTLRANASDSSLQTGVGIRAGVEAQVWVNTTGPAEVQAERLDVTAMLLNTTDLEGDRVLTVDRTGPTRIEGGTWPLEGEGEWTMTMRTLMDEGEVEVCLDGAPVECVQETLSGEVGPICRYPAFELPADVVVDASSDDEAHFHGLVLPAMDNRDTGRGDPIRPECTTVDLGGARTSSTGPAPVPR